jgi:hypothetical protein
MSGGHRPLTSALFALCVLASASAFGEASAGKGGEDKRCHSAIAHFLRVPSSTSFAAINPAADNKCSYFTVEQLQGLDKLAASGDRYAAQLLASQIRTLDGGELEDALRSLGEFGSRHMQEFIGPAVAGAMTDRNLADALTMLPLDLEDNFDAQLAELRKRRSALEGLADKGAQQRGKAAIASLDKFIGEVERAQSADKAQPKQPQ